MRLPGILCAACLTAGRNVEAVDRSTHPTSREVPGGRLAESELPSPPPPADILNLRLTDDPIILRAVGHTGYAIDERYRRHGYASRALLALRRVARHYGIAPLWAFIAPGNVASRRTAERAGLTLVDTVSAAPEALQMGLEPELCRYTAE